MCKMHIRNCRASDIRAVARNLRAEEIEECAKIAVKPRHIMHALYRTSTYSRALLIDDECAAVGGDAAGALSFRGHVWFFSTPLIERVPVAFYRIMRDEIARRLETRDSLITSVTVSSERCMRFWRMLGAEIGEPDIIGREIRFAKRIG